MKERLVELLMHTEAYTAAEEEYAREQAKYKANYLLANGVIVLPCEVGHTIYDAREYFCGVTHPEIYEMKNDSIVVEKDNKSGEYRFIYDDAYISFDEIGKTVFLSREEAEAKLKGGAE